MSDFATLLSNDSITIEQDVKDIYEFEKKIAEVIQFVLRYVSFLFCIVLLDKC